MLFSLRSIVLFSELMAASVPVVVVGAVPVPSAPDDPVVTPGALLAPDDCAVPALLVPGAVAAPGALLLPCAIDMAGEIKIAVAAMATMADALIIGKSPFTP